MPGVIAQQIAKKLCKQNYTQQLTFTKIKNGVRSDKKIYRNIIKKKKHLGRTLQHMIDTK